MSEDMGPLFEALARAQAKVKGAEKDGLNPHFKSRYATLASVWEACREALSSEGLAVAQTFDIVDGGRAVLVTVLGHKSGAMLTSRYPLNAAKEDPQGMSAAATYARRVTLAAIAGVAPEDDDGETAQGRGEIPRKTEAKPQPPAEVPPATPNEPVKTITQMDAIRVIALAKRAGYRTREDMLVYLREIGGPSVVSVVTFPADKLDDLTARLELMAQVNADVQEVFGNEQPPA